MPNYVAIMMCPQTASDISLVSPHPPTSDKINTRRKNLRSIKIQDAARDIIHIELQVVGKRSTKNTILYITILNQKSIYCH